MLSALCINTGGYENINLHDPHISNLEGNQHDQVKDFWRQRPELRAWAMEISSGVLFLSGESFHDEKVVLNITHGIISEAVASPQPNVIILRYACDQNEKNQEQAMLVMMQSLLRQLLLRQTETDSLSLPRSRLKTDLEGFRDIFESLIKQLADDAKIICVIQGLQLLFDQTNKSDGGRSSQKIKKMFMSMDRLVETARCCFRLLLTSWGTPQVPSNLGIRASSHASIVTI